MRNRTVGAIVLLAAAIALAVTLWSSYEQRKSAQTLTRYVNCQSDINEQFLETLKAQTAINTQDRETTRDLVIDIFRPDGTSSAEEAAKVYIKRQMDLDKLRDDFKFPEFTTCQVVQPAENSDEES